MRGTWLTAIARRVTRRETFDSLVAPALADLQYESAARRPIGRHYAAFVIVIATAVLRDLRTDVHLTFAASRVWRRTAAWWSGFGGLYVWLVLHLDTPWHLLDASGQATVFLNALTAAAVVALPYALAAAVFYLRRESAAPRRAVAVAAFSFVGAAIVLNLTVTAMRPATSRILVESVSRVMGEQRPGASLDSRARYKGHWQTWLETRRNQSTQAPSMLAAGGGRAAINSAFMSALNLVPYVMVGVALTRGRRWTVFLRVIGIFATYVFIGILTLRLHMFTGQGLSGDAKRQVVATFLTGTMWLLGIRLFMLPLLPVYALTTVRKWFPRRSSH